MVKGLKIRNQEKYNAPTHQFAMAWLRGKGIHANPIEQGNANEPPSGQYTWCVSSHGRIYRNHTVSEKLTYEEAAEAALLYVLQNLI